MFDIDKVKPEHQELRDQVIDEIVNTLRNMGNVHSLRGEQDEAMRYYSEVTGLRAARATKKDTASIGSGNDSAFWGDEDTSTLMSELNEDVKALDDLFRSISFRNGKLTDGETTNLRSDLLAPSPEDKNRKRRRNSGLQTDQRLEREVFKRSTSSLNSADVSTSLSTKTEVEEALDTYRTVLAGFNGENIDQHDEHLNSFSLRANLLIESRKKKSSPREEEIKLALEVYSQALAAQKEMNESPEQDKDEEPQASANIASTMIRMGGLYYRLNNVDGELKMYREARSVYQNAYGENHPYVAGTRKNIGMVLAERGEYQASMDEFEKAQRIYLEVNQGNEICRDNASAISCMGNVKNRVGELDDALVHYKDALRIYTSLEKQERDKGTETAANAIRDVTATLKIIGVVHAKKGDMDDAMTAFVEAMSMLRSAKLDHTPSGQETIASIVTRIAGIHLKKGDYEKAMIHYEEAHELIVSLRGMNSPDIAGILHSIGGIHHKNRDYRRAMDCYQEAVRVYHATLGPGNPAVAATLVCIGSIHYKQRNLDSAMMFYREALRLNRDAYGLHHPDVAPTLKSIGTILTKKSAYDEAYDVFRDVLSIQCTVHGTGHPEVANAYKSLGNIHYKRGELADAERQYRHALNIYRRSKGEDHPDTASARTSIEHIRYWMKEKRQRDMQKRSMRNSGRDRGCNLGEEREL
jgi:tetratricopeptide (TPR) repeat protein